MDTATLTPSSLFCAKTLIFYLHSLDFIQFFFIQDIKFSFTAFDAQYQYSVQLLPI